MSLIEDPKGFWSQWCPRRGTALTHAHWAECDPKDGGHPESGDIHSFSQCCHCGDTSTAWAAQQTKENFEALETVAAPPPETVGSYDREEEPAMAQGTYPGPVWGPGRGIMGFKLRGQLNLIAYIERTRGYR